MEFAVFCIENVARCLGAGAEQVYHALTKKSNLFYDYIVPEYEMLHTQSKDYIVDEILGWMEESRVAL